MNDQPSGAAAPTPTLPPESSADDAFLLAAAQAADAGRDLPAAPAPAAKAPAKTKEPAPLADGAPGATKTPDPKPGDTVSPAPDPAPEPKADEKKKSPYEEAKERKAKEEARLSESWRKLDEEKAAVRREAAELAEQRRRLQPDPQSPRKPAEPARDERGLTAEDYEEVARTADRNGEDGVAKLARKRAEALRAPAAPEPAPKAVVPAEDLAEEGRALMAERPELRDPAHPLTAEANRLLTDPGTASFFRRAGGVKAAVQVAELRMAAATAGQWQAEATTAKAEVAKLRAELETLRAATGMTGSPGVPPKPRSGELSDEELLAAAMDADRGGS